MEADAFIGFAGDALHPADFFQVGEHSADGDILTIIDTPTTVTPEPQSLILLGTGLLGFIETGRKKRA